MSWHRSSRPPSGSFTRHLAVDESTLTQLTASNDEDTPSLKRHSIAGEWTARQYDDDNALICGNCQKQQSGYIGRPRSALPVISVHCRVYEPRGDVPRDEKSMMSPTLDFEVMKMMFHPLRRGTNKSSHQAIAPGLDALEGQDTWSDSMLHRCRAVVNEVRCQCSTYLQISRDGGAGLYLAAYMARFEKEVKRAFEIVQETCSAYRRHRQVHGKANDEGEWELYGMIRELKMMVRRPDREKEQSERLSGSGMDIRI